MNTVMDQDTQSNDDKSVADTDAQSGIKRRGFASMSKERRIEVAKNGGRAAHQSGRAHRFSSQEAQDAGRKGGQRTGQNIEHMAHIGTLGSASRWRNKAAVLPAYALAGESESETDAETIAPTDAPIQAESAA